MAAIFVCQFDKTNRRLQQALSQIAKFDLMSYNPLLYLSISSGEDLSM